MKYDKIIVRCAFIYFFWMFFYGIIIKLTISNSILFQIKTYVTDLMLVFIIIAALLKSRKIYTDFFVFVSAILVDIIINLLIHDINSDSITAVLYATRGFIAPMLAGYELLHIEIDDKEIERLFSWLRVLALMFLIGNTILSFLQNTMGYEWASSFYTGYSFFGTDSYSKIRITMASGLLRAPGLSGAFSSSAMYSLLSMFLLISNDKNKIPQFIVLLLAGTSIWLTYNKTVLVIFMIILVLHLLSRFPRNTKYILFLIVIAVFCSGIIWLSTRIGVDEGDLGFSTLARFEFWKSLANIVSPLEILLPYNMVNYAANAEGMLSCWDNFYLYCLFSFGLVGLYFFIRIIRKLSTVNLYKNSANYYFYLYFTIALLLAALFNNISNGKSLLGMFLIISGVGYGYNNKLLKRSEIEDE